VPGANCANAHRGDDVLAGYSPYGDGQIYCGQTNKEVIAWAMNALEGSYGEALRIRRSGTVRTASSSPRSGQQLVILARPAERGLQLFQLRRAVAGFFLLGSGKYPCGTAVETAE
jgi:hypothetical protein